jgi:SAM-dependent methyltransferase
MADDVVSHYGGADVSERILRAVIESGLDLADPDALAGVDEFHLGGRSATEALLDDVDPAPGSSVVDVGCGIGGAARVMARRGCRVLGVDLTPSFVEAARELSSAAGFGDDLRFEVGSALELPVDDASVDLVTMLHVGMNVDDKSALMAEFGRVLRSGATLAVYDIMRIGDGDITFPVPWASDLDHSFVASPDEYRTVMTDAGFTEVRAISRLQLVVEAVASQQASPPPVHLGHLMGSEMPVMFGNLMALLNGGVLAPIQLTGRR